MTIFCRYSYCTITLLFPFAAFSAAFLYALGGYKLFTAEFAKATRSPPEKFNHPACKDICGQIATCRSANPSAPPSSASLRKAFLRLA